MAGALDEPLPDDPESPLLLSDVDFELPESFPEPESESDLEPESEPCSVLAAAGLAPSDDSFPSFPEPARLSVR